MHCDLSKPRLQEKENVKGKGRENVAVIDMDEKLDNSASAAPQKHHPSSVKLSRASSDAAKEAAEYSAKYRIYERDYLRRINHKYFSGKNLAGTGRVFETATTVDGFTVKESRETPIKRFLELPSSSEEHSKSGAPSSAKKPTTRKS